MNEVWSAPVRFSEYDPLGVVHNANYLTWVDEASGAWWLAIGGTFAEQAAVPRVVKTAQLEWSSAARHGDTVVVDVEVERLGRSSLTLVFVVRVGTRTCCRAVLTYVAVADGRPTPWPDDVRARFAASAAEPGAGTVG